jgi:hypothetical protein
VRFSLIHVDDHGHSDEVMLVLPGVDKTVLAVPLGALGELLPMVTGASAHLPAATCPECGGDPLPPRRQTADGA